jgi:tripartite-type tricarboxylate transporter receptor subunit TctC
METGRALAAPSHISPEHREYLRRVVENILTDPMVKREASARGRAIEFAPSNVLQIQVERALGNLGESTRNELKHVIVEKFLP